jgi:CelD/BcsL family acetyltransferase involved in cellulose biosynthesis
MRVTVVRPDDIGPSEASLWTTYQRASRLTNSPFYSLTFAKVVAQFRPNARIAVVEDDGKIQAFLPFELRAAKTAVPIGHPMNDLQGFISSGAMFDARLAMKLAGLRGWRFTHAPAEQLVLVPHHYRETTIEVPIADLSDGYERYAESLSRSLVTKNGRRRRALERLAGPVSFEWRESHPAKSLKQLMQWKAEKYYTARQMLSRPDELGIIAELSTAESPDCIGLVGVLRAGERSVAINFALKSPGCLAGWFSAYDNDLQQFSPGIMMYLAVAEAAASHDTDRYELGHGQHGYKSRLANSSYLGAGGAVWASRSEEAIRRVYRWFRIRAADQHARKAGSRRVTPEASL